jgi:hypothetical protein
MTPLIKILPISLSEDLNARFQQFKLTLAAFGAAFLALGFPREKVMLISLNPATEEIRRAETASFMVDV